MVEVQTDLGIFPAEFLSVSHSTLSHVAEKGSVSIVAGTLRYLKDYGRFFFSGCLDDSLELLHIVEVESGNGITAFDCLGKHLTGVDQA